ncbi:MAG: acyltransferase [Kiritimatiellae bacterium]|nr:acyltransferase [Kiritimatiellia bacterium]
MGVDSTKGRIEFLDWLRAVACFLVMLIHSCECIYSNDYTYSFPSETARWSIVFISGFARVAVPLFLMASAFLLVPVKTDMLSFYRRRLSRVAVPFVAWLVLCAVLPAAWGEWGWGESWANLRHVFINFVPRESHLWFVYMLLGVYFVMPIVSPWLERCSAREELVLLGIWLFTSLFWRFHEAFGPVFGECWWNPWPTFHYVSGPIGYMLLAHWIRFRLAWTPRQIVVRCVPIFIACWAWCIYSFYTRSFRVEAVSALEIDWQPTAFAPVLMSFAAFALMTLIHGVPAALRNAVAEVSRQSYGMYLMHMMFLPAWFGVMSPRLPAPAAIIATALAAYVTSFVVTWALSKVPYVRRIVG